ncbi:hypothetical protein V8C26DRAFT_397224 [Trichoderma gracile]
MRDPVILPDPVGALLTKIRTAIDPLQGQPAVGAEGKGDTERASPFLYLPFPSFTSFSHQLQPLFQSSSIHLQSGLICPCRYSSVHAGRDEYKTGCSSSRSAAGEGFHALALSRLPGCPTKIRHGQPAIHGPGEATLI